jgi:DNA-nicking Smr family endonuclease
MTGEPPGPRRRRRELSEEEHALWRGIARSVRPLRKAPRRVAEDPQPAPAVPARPVPKGKVLTAVAPSRVVAPASPPPLATFARREKRELARGRTAIDARIDLHGKTQAQAHAALVRFLHRAQQDGAKFALVITGKGARPGEPERGVLRRQVPMWLQLPDLRDIVVGFEEAHVGHGGEGALYVRLRRGRETR